MKDLRKVRQEIRRPNSDDSSLKFRVIFSDRILTMDLEELPFLRVGYRNLLNKLVCIKLNYRGADKSLARPGRKQATATEDFEFHISYL